jgi:hypothetical protein
MLDETVRTFFEHYTPGPVHTDVDRRYIGYAIDSLRERYTPPGVYDFLADTAPISSRFVVSALPDIGYKAHKALVYMGPRKEVFGPLVASLRDERIDPTLRVMAELGPSSTMYDYMISLGAKQPAYQARVKYAFEKLGVNKTCVQRLTWALGKVDKQDFAKQVLLSLGPEVQAFLPKPERKTKMYRPLRDIIFSYR